MYCGYCGNQLEDHFRYCSRCGAATNNAPRPGFHGLSRPREGKKLAGVCAGFARYLDLDVTVVRVVWVLLVLFPPVPGLLAYIICWIVMPQDPPPPQPEARPAGPAGPAQPVTSEAG